MLQLGAPKAPSTVGITQPAKRSSYIGKERTCKECQSEEVEDVCHWLLQCPAWDHLRRPLVEEVSQCDGFQGQSLTKQGGFVLATAYTIHTLLNYVSQLNVVCQI